jgi:hypothetical protein
MEREYIPCEICDVLVDFNDYMTHLEQCQSRTSILTFPFSFTLTNLNPQEQDENDLDGNDLDGNDLDGNDPESLNPPDQLDYLRNMMANLFQHISEFSEQNTYENLRSLDDVVIPCKDIDKVAPLVPLDQIDQIPPDTMCPICQELISNDSRKTICNHYFCSSCLEPWLEVRNKTCPVCSLDLDDFYLEKHPEEKHLYVSNENSDSLEETESLEEETESLEDETESLEDETESLEEETDSESLEEDPEELEKMKEGS